MQAGGCAGRVPGVVRLSLDAAKSREALDPSLSFLHDLDSRLSACNAPAQDST